MKKLISITLASICCLACTVSAAGQTFCSPRQIKDTLRHKTAQARQKQLPWHIDPKAVMDVSISYATGRYRGMVEIVEETHCKALALNKKGLLLLGKDCAQTLQGPAQNFRITISLPYKNKEIMYKHQDFFAKNFKRKGDFALYQMLAQVEYHSQAQATRGITAPRVLSAPVTEIFKNITIPALFGLTPQDDTFILEDFSKIFPGQKPDETLASWLQKKLPPEEFKLLVAR